MHELQDNNKNMDKPRKFINASQTTLSKVAQALLPSYEALRQRLQRKKVDHYGDLMIPRSLAEIDLVEEFRWTCKHKLFLNYDSGKNDPNRFSHIYN